MYTSIRINKPKNYVSVIYNIYTSIHQCYFLKFYKHALGIMP